MVPLAVVGARRPGSPLRCSWIASPGHRTSTSDASMTGIVSRAGLRRRHRLRPAAHRPLPRGAAPHAGPPRRHARAPARAAAPAILRQRRHRRSSACSPCCSPTRDHTGRSAWPARSASPSPLLFGPGRAARRAGVCRRGLFWPFVPEVGSADPRRPAVWAGVGGGSAGRRPAPVCGRSRRAAARRPGPRQDSAPRIGLAETEQFRTEAEAVDGLKTSSRGSSPPAPAQPVVIMTTPAAADAAVAAAAEGVAGVAVGRGPASGPRTLRPARRGARPPSRTPPDELPRPSRDLRGRGRRRPTPTPWSAARSRPTWTPATRPDRDLQADPAADPGGRRCWC